MPLDQELRNPSGHPRALHPQPLHERQPPPATTGKSVLEARAVRNRPKVRRVADGLQQLDRGAGVDGQDLPEEPQLAGPIQREPVEAGSQEDREDRDDNAAQREQLPKQGRHPALSAADAQQKMIIICYIPPLRTLSNTSCPTSPGPSTVSPSSAPKSRASRCCSRHCGPPFSRARRSARLF